MFECDGLNETVKLKTRPLRTSFNNLSGASDAQKQRIFSNKTRLYPTPLRFNFLASTCPFNEQ